MIDLDSPLFEAQIFRDSFARFADANLVGVEEGSLPVRFLSNRSARIAPRPSTRAAAGR